MACFHLQRSWRGLNCTHCSHLNLSQNTCCANMLVLLHDCLDEAVTEIERQVYKAMFALELFSGVQAFISYSSGKPLKIAKRAVTA